MRLGTVRPSRHRSAARGIMVSHEAIRQWCRKCGQDDAHRLRRRRAQPGDTWPLDEVFFTINGERHALWRAVEQDENVRDMLVQSRRTTHAAQGRAVRATGRHHG